MEPRILTDTVLQTVFPYGWTMRTRVVPASAAVRWIDSVDKSVGKVKATWELPRRTPMETRLSCSYYIENKHLEDQLNVLFSNMPVSGPESAVCISLATPASKGMRIACHTAVMTRRDNNWVSPASPPSDRYGTAASQYPPLMRLPART
ncbi:hypothetical protein GCM10007862_01390 [Dyella lipolytica]|nr:hypothetical protein GCM10007862_01390 [Dyella lipolytica]